MFKISPINDKLLQEKYANDCGTAYIPDSFAYAMIDNETEELMGFSQFEITENGGIIYDLKPRLNFSDYEAMFILGRATMNFIDLCVSSHNCYAKEASADKKLLHAIGFKTQKDGLYFCDMSEMFSGKCDSHKD